MSKTDREQLREYEPILCFSGGDYTERFYPINVEAYLAQCTLWERQRGILRWLLRPRDVTPKWDSEAEKVSLGDTASSLGKAQAEALGSGKFDQQHFLRFVPRKEAKQEERKKEYVESVLITSGCASVIALLLLAAAIWAWQAGVIWLAWVTGGIAACFLLLIVYLFLLAKVNDEVAEAVPGFLFGVLLLGLAVWARSAGINWAAWLTGVLGVLMFLGGLMAIFENSLTPGAAAFLTMLVGMVVAVVPPLWVAMYLRWRWYVAVPAVGWLLAALLAIVAFRGEQGLAAFLALTSPLRRKASDRAHGLSQALYERPEDEGGAQYIYYGRVWPNSTASRVVLQYFLFYPFNDWRSHGGFNFHEGDWEAVFVFLERRNDKLVPTDVGLSQHHEGDCRPWGEIKPWRDSEGGEHPVIYVAAGSHANYFTRDDKPLRSLFTPGWKQKLVAHFERFREQFQPDAERQRQLLTAVVKSRGKEGQPRPEDRGDEAAPKLGERATQRVPKAEEHPNGRGLIIGPGKPKEVLAEQTVKPWAEPVILKDGALSGWVKFRGLWGIKTLLKDESGPPGPKWEREGHKVEEADKEALKKCEGCRLYWADPIHWLEKAREARRKNSDEGETG